MINCELGAEETIMEKLKEIEQVKDVFGTHDMMVKLDAENFGKLERLSPETSKNRKNSNNLHTCKKR